MREVTGEWAVVETNNGRYLAQLIESKEELLKKWADKQPLAFRSVFEFQIQAVPISETQMRREGMATPYGMCTHDYATYISPVLICFLSDMGGNDREKHLEIIRRGFRMVERLKSAESIIKTASMGDIAKVNKLQ